MAYNLRGWETSETLYNGAENWTLGYSYNAAGARTRVTYPDATYVAYEYDNRGLLSKIPGLFENLSGFGTPGFSYDANGRLTGSKSANGVVTQRSYDTTGRLGSISTYISVPGDIFSQTYQYTPKDLISSITEYTGSSRTLQFGYDAIGRLTSADIYGYQDRAKVLYSYDGAGNRLTEVWKDAQNLTVESFNYNYNPGNYLENKGSSSFITGSYGQMTSRTEAGITTTYVYNPMRMMKEASEAGVTLAKYEYDALGRRIISWLDNEWRTVSLWSGNDSIYEIRQEWTIPPPNPPIETITRYVAVNGQYLAKLVGSPIAMQPYFHHTDIVGTIRAVTDINGAVVARYAYEPFGSLTTASGLVDGELHRFTGKPSDLETDLSYFNARYYDPALGRFTSSDPARDGLNWYQYCNGNPLMFVDQSGRSTMSVGMCIYAAAGIRGAVTVTFVLDSQGGTGLIYSGAIGGGTPTAGISLVGSLTNAESGSELVGLGAETGGTAIGIGVEYITGATEEGNWNGVTISGFNLGGWIPLFNFLSSLLPVEYHLEFSATGYIQVKGWLAEKARGAVIDFTTDQINALSSEERLKIEQQLGISIDDYLKAFNR